MQKLLANRLAFLLTVLLVVVPLLALGSVAVHASQSEAGPEIPPSLRSSLGTVVAASPISETHPIYMPIVMKDGPAPTCERPVAGAAIGGASNGTVNTQYVFTATPSPADATTPVTYNWSPQPLSGQGTASATYQWSAAGSQTVMVEATNCGGSVDAEHTIAITAACASPVAGAAIGGASNGTVNTQYVFTATPSPADATTPVTYNWSPQPLSGQGTASATYQWSAAGSQTVMVEATNCGGSVDAEHTIAITAPTSGIPVASVLTPFDANVNDLNGPDFWSNRYGKSPEIVVASSGVALDVLAQDYDAGTTWNAVLLHIEKTATGYEVTQALTGLPWLDRVMGLASDTAGNRYYATGVSEGDRVDANYPPINTTRSDIVRVLKLNKAGNVLFNIDLDPARRTLKNDAEMIVNPMEASTSRLAVGADEIALLHGINTDPDPNIGGQRHQKALSTRLNATSGDILRTASAWVSHSFDQRLLFDGTGIIENHLGDAYPRTLVFGRNDVGHPLFHIKGNLGENSTHTRLGNIALIEQDANYGYLALFATESNATTGEEINGPRNLAIVRVKKDDNSIDPSLPDTLTVTSSGTQQTNRLRWLTQYQAGSNQHAERPKLIGIGNDQYIVIWEEWLSTPPSTGTFNGVYGMVIDANGNVLQPSKLITNAHHLHRGDDAFLLDGRAAWMTGNAAAKKLYIHFVDSTLNYNMVTLD